MIGRTLSHYTIRDEISRGGMGIVYRATDLKLNREVALKVLPPELVADPECRAAAVVIAAAGLAWVLLRPRPTAFVRGSKPSIAVLDFENNTGDVLGSYVKAGPTLRISVKVQETSSGEIFTSERVEGSVETTQ